MSKVSKMKFYKKILDIQKYNIVRHWFSSKNWNFAIFFKKVSIDGFTHFSSKIHPKFSKNRLFHNPNILYIYDQNFMLVPTIKLLEFSDKNWETYEIYKNTTLYDIDFPQKIGILRFFLRKFLLTVFHIFMDYY